MKRKWAALLLLLPTLAVALCGCASKQKNDQVYQQLLTAFADAGYAAVLEAPPQDAPIPIYNASVWKALQTGEDTVLVYFDESNRADYLLTMIDQEQYGYATHAGQRFILVYNGENAALKAFLETLE